MLRPLRRGARRALRTANAGALVDAYRKGILVDEGWFASFKTQQAIRASGEPIPWYTYAFIHFLEPRLQPTHRVFEYGSGNSTRWYARRSAGVVAVEHDEDWARRIGPLLAPPSEVLTRRSDDDYVGAIAGRGPFDVVVVDGIERLRPACARAALDELSDDGVVVWDNSDRAEFEEGMALLRPAGFRHIPFKGLGPTAITAWETSVVYRDRNCLGI
ncbi:MAG TPA: FkbM family methyltransferase [Actinomycetota bacterium]|nr:FkbM family methyltransferase [Actinomycetota bacterium]